MPNSPKAYAQATRRNINHVLVDNFFVKPITTFGIQFLCGNQTKTSSIYTHTLKSPWETASVHLSIFAIPSHLNSGFVKMAYADRKMMAMSSHATEYYDRVRFEVWKNSSSKASEVESVLKDAEMFVLDNMFESKTTSNVSADWFRWKVAKAAWNEYCKSPSDHRFLDLLNNQYSSTAKIDPFPLENEEPYVHDIPCCEQYFRYWYLQNKFPVTMGSDRITVSSSADTTTTQARKALAQNVHSSPLALTPCGEPLAFPIPKVRQLELCVGDDKNMQPILSEAASILGPEFTLLCSFDGRRPAVVTLGLAPGVDYNNRNVSCEPATRSTGLWTDGKPCSKARPN